MADSSDCIFCKIVAGTIPSIRVAESREAVAFMDIGPIARGHTLVIPKRHCETLADMSPEEAGAVFALAARVAPALQETVDSEGINVLQNNGRVAGQVVMHVHVHLIPRWSGDGLKWPWPAREADTEELRSLAREISGNLAS